MNDYETLKRKVEVLEKFVQSLQTSSLIPLPVDQAIRERFLNPLVKQTEKAASSETRTVDEGGGATYDVLKVPDGFDKRFDKEIGQYKYYPWFNLT